jgi:hypothetical protein
LLSSLSVYVSSENRLPPIREHDDVAGLEAGDRRALLAALAYSEPPVAQAHNHKAGDVLVIKSAFGRAHDFAVVFGEDGIAHNVDAMTSRLLLDEAQAAGGEGRPTR